MMEAFPPTQWTQVLEAASRDPERARAAAAALCGRYRAAIVAWFARDAGTRAEAEDLAHDFLTRWLVRDAPLGHFERGGRRFRVFLGVCLRHFAAERHARSSAARRGGRAVHEPLREGHLPVAAGADGGDGPDLELARQLFREVEAELTGRWAPRVPAVGGYARLRDLALAAEPAIGYAALAAALGVPVGTLKGWVFRLRREYYEGFLARVRPLADAADVDGEMRHLHGLLLRHGHD